MGNLTTVLDQAADQHGERPVLRMDDLVLSYRELREAAGRVTSLLSSLRIEPGDRVALMMPNVPAFPVIFYGAIGAGAVVGDEAAKGAESAGAEMIRVDEPDASSVLAGLEPAGRRAERAEDDDAVILYTSGTTGQPKGAELTHANLTRNAELTAVTLIKAGPDDVIMGCLPLFHVFGLTCGLLATICSGSCLTLLPRFDPAKALEIIGRDKVTIFEGVPTMYAAMLHQPGSADADVSSLRTCISGGAAMPVELMRSFERTFGCIILEGYGLSETSPVASFNHPDKVRKPGSIGTPILGVEMRVVDADGADVPVGEIGEIAIRGHNIMKG
ncbi:MAG: AMP-binding protein, partial [Streptosporangiaceae bacterium]